MTTVTPPPGWGADILSDFQANAIQNEYASYVHLKGWQEAFINCATALRMCTDYSMSLAYSANATSHLLFIAAHNHFLAAVRLALSGQALPTYPVGRACVEAALYGYYLAKVPEATARWHSKPTERAALRAWSREFSVSNISSLLSAGQAEWTRFLHQTAIDYGAHPNTQALYSNMAQKELADGGVHLENIILHAWGLSAANATKFALEAGMFTIALFATAYPEADAKYSLSDLNVRLVSSLDILKSEFEK
ncbi:hypothetical protein [Herbaspirillum sp. VT-16-41]|uniref:hypothetical protein n=1 Tax=Herbaspirillum sp. VT-16-41 TaxID=1953765 RepID=UPI0011159D99|nr:hypothetical protein [Herbaspirillum sp. VT-16-41]